MAAIHQPQFMPWLGYFDKIVRSDIFIFIDNVQFKKNEFQNRNKVKTAQGWMWLTIPVLYQYPEHINEVRINNRIDWRKKHLRALEINYHKAPYFDDFFPDVEHFYAQDSEFISETNRASVLMLMGMLGIHKETEVASALGHLPEEPSERLAAICEFVKADTYLSGTGGQDYLDLEPFNKKGITVLFQDFKHPVYMQLYGDFIPYLSLLDLLFNCGPDSLKILEGAG
jgi:hypothetical protein